MKALELDVGLGKAPMGKSKDDPMGDAPPSSKPAGDLDAFDAALDDAWEAVKSDSKDSFKEALGAAITAKVSEMSEEGE